MKNSFITISCPAVLLFVSFFNYVFNFLSSEMLVNQRVRIKHSESSASLVYVCGFVVLPDVNLVKCSWNVSIEICSMTSEFCFPWTIFQYSWGFPVWSLRSFVIQTFLYFVNAVFVAALYSLHEFLMRFKFSEFFIFSIFVLTLHHSMSCILIIGIIPRFMWKVSFLWFSISHLNWFWHTTIRSWSFQHLAQVAHYTID